MTLHKGHCRQGRTHGPDYGRRRKAPRKDQGQIDKAPDDERHHKRRQRQQNTQLLHHKSESQKKAPPRKSLHRMMVHRDPSFLIFIVARQGPSDQLIFSMAFSLWVYYN